MSTPLRVRRPDAPPPLYWLIPAAVAALRMLPAVSLYAAPAPAGQRFTGVSYLPKDFLQYAAFIRQSAVDGAFFFYDPFTTDPQSSRFVLVFHWLVGVVARVAEISPIDALEGSRIPLVFVFFATLWWFARPFLANPKDRLFAALLVGFASGIDAWLRPFAALFPPGFRERFLQDTWTLQGWSLFASFHNPLWIAALCVALFVLRPLLIGGERSIRQRALTSAAFLFVYTLHPYTAIGVLGIAGIQPFVTLLSGARPDWRRHLADAATLAPALIVIGALNHWQMQDPVFRATAVGIFGSQNLSPLWYPITLGLLGGMAVVGARRALAELAPHRLALFGWTLAIGALHWLPVLNGYKFVFLLPLPLCLLAAPVAREVLGRWRGPGLRERCVALGASIVLFAGAGLQSVDEIRTTRAVSSLPSELMNVIETLATQPAGNALVPASLGNALPAFTPHRVWLGHWFLTPDFVARSETFRRLFSDPDAAAELRELVREQHIAYLVIPASLTKRVTEALAPAAVQRIAHGRVDLLVLRPSAPATRGSDGRSR